MDNQEYDEVKEMWEIIDEAKALWLRFFIYLSKRERKTKFHTEISSYFKIDDVTVDGFPDVKIILDSGEIT